MVQDASKLMYYLSPVTPDVEFENCVACRHSTYLPSSGLIHKFILLDILDSLGFPISIYHNKTGISFDHVKFVASYCYES